MFKLAHIKGKLIVKTPWFYHFQFWSSSSCDVSCVVSCDVSCGVSCDVSCGSITFSSGAVVRINFLQKFKMAATAAILDVELKEKTLIVF